MVKALRVSDATHRMLVHVVGDFTAALGKRLTFDEAIELLIREHDERMRQASRGGGPSYSEDP